MQIVQHKHMLELPLLTRVSC